MTYTISKTFTFAAAHHLPQLPDEHKCRRPHGHNYTVTLVLAAEKLDERGMVFDYGDLGPAGKWIRDSFDHRDLNEQIDWPTAEILAVTIYRYLSPRLPALAEVTVRETPATTATFRP